MKIPYIKFRRKPFSVSRTDICWETGGQEVRTAKLTPIQFNRASKWWLNVTGNSTTNLNLYVKQLILLSESKYIWTPSTDFLKNYTTLNFQWESNSNMRTDGRARTDGRTDKCRWTDRHRRTQTDVQVDGRTDTDRRTGLRTDRQTGWRTDYGRTQTDGRTTGGQTVVRTDTDSHTDGRTDGRRVTQTDGRTNRWKDYGRTQTVVRTYEQTQTDGRTERRKQRNGQTDGRRQTDGRTEMTKTIDDVRDYAQVLENGNLATISGVCRTSVNYRLDSCFMYRTVPQQASEPCK